MPNTHPFAMSIAGLDPSGGAGLMADIKTFEAHKVYGFGTCTALTFQNDIQLEETKWFGFEEISKQILISCKRFEIMYFKIGIISGFQLLIQVIHLILKLKPNAKIIWDPVLESSSGFKFHSKIDRDLLLTILRKITLVTPNLGEAQILSAKPPGEFGKLPVWIGQNKLCPILVKGGHSNTNQKNDVLYTNESATKIAGQDLGGTGKHGTGCVLSSAILANMANGLDLPKACYNAKSYINKFITSNPTLLGYHFYN